MPKAIPTPELTSHYLALKEMASADRLREAEAADPSLLGREFNAAVGAFESFSAWPQGFYDQDPALRDEGKNPKSDARTYGWGMAMKKQVTVPVLGDSDLSFRYVDREIVPTRTKPRRVGPSLEVDLVLANADTDRPIISELKIASDKDPYTGLVQGLAGAAQMVSDSQRERLCEHAGRVSGWFSGSLAAKAKEPRIDLYVLLADFPKVGRHRYEQLGRAVALAEELEAKAMCDGLDRIRILSLSKSPDGVVKASTELPSKGA